MNMLHKAMTIAGSDASGGAGMEADLKTFQELDVYGMTALTLSLIHICIITKATLKLLPLCPYKLDLLAIFTDLDKAVGLVPNLIKAGLNPTSVEFMDNAFVRSSSDYCALKLPHYEDGFYVIVTVEDVYKRQVSD